MPYLFVSESYVWSQCFVFHVHAGWDHQVVHEHHVLVFNDCFWLAFPEVFWNWDIETAADVPVDYYTYIVVPLCVQLF